MTSKNQKTEQTNEKTVETADNKPYGRAAVPINAAKGKTNWYDVGPVWKKKEGEGFIIEIGVLPVGNFEGPLRVVVTPAKDEE